MKHLLLRGIILGWVGVAAISGPLATAQDRTAREQFVGTWRLVSLEQPGPDGKPHRNDCAGMLITTQDGHISVQVMERNPEPQSTPGTEQYSQGGYEASYGTYVLDEGAHMFTFHVEGALVRGLIGKDLPRSYEFSGNTMIVKSTRPDEHWRVTWERYQ
jgi:hypothetical protein